MKRKVYAYITHGRGLLVFRRLDSPEAGIQVPGGTVQTGESPEAAVLREARQETGLTHLAVVAFLGEAIRDLTSKTDAMTRRFVTRISGAQPAISSPVGAEVIHPSGKLLPLLAIEIALKRHVQNRGFSWW